MPKEIPQHRDKLGQTLNIGDCVVYPQTNTLIVGTVRKFNPKMIGVTRIDGNWARESNKYPCDVVKVSGPEVTMYLIKAAAK
jgi:hypothetical protein